MRVEIESARRTLRALVIFVIAFNLLGWLGWMIAQEGTADAVGLGNLIWLVSPLLVAILVSLFTKDWRDFGLRPNFAANGRWYVFSVLVFPVIVAVIVLAGVSLGTTSLSEFRGIPFLQALAVAAAFTFVKNILEEFTWRGFLTPRVGKLVKSALTGHLIVGLIWALWHVPYYLALIDRAQFAAYTSLSLAVYLPMAIVGITVAGILFGELRLITGSTWPGVVMHTVSNLFITTLLVDGHVTLSGRAAFLLTPGWEGVLSMALIAAMGLWLYRQRVGRMLESYVQRA